MRQFEQTRSLLVLVSKGILHQEQHFALSLVCILTQGGILEYRNLVMENLRFRISRFVTFGPFPMLDVDSVTRRQGATRHQ